MALSFKRTTFALHRDSHLGSLALLGVGLTLLGLWSLWLVLGRVSIYASSDVGRLEITNTVTFEAAESGEVGDSSLVLGAHVLAGQPLVRLRCARQQVALRAAVVRQRTLQQELTATTRELQVRERAIVLAKSEGASAVRVARSRYRKAAVLARHARERASRYRKLWPRGVVSKQEYLDARASAQRSYHESSQLAVSITAERQRYSSAHAQRQAELAELRRAEARLRGSIDKLAVEQQRLRLEIERRTLRAPQSGQLVQVMQLSSGMFLQHGRRLATIIPAGELIAAARFAPRVVVGRVFPGQHATLRPHGFPLRRSRVHARVASVSAEPQEDGLMRVELRVQGKGAMVPLQHGLPVRVEVEVERISPAVLLLRAIGRSSATRRGH